MKLESDFQKYFREALESILPGCIILKNDPTLRQGFPDLILLYKNKYAVFEMKRNSKSSKRPNQQYYIDYLGQWVIARIVSPENYKEVLNEVQRSF